MLFDSHCHLDLAVFDNDREALLARCRHRGVGRLLIPAIEERGWERLLGLCRREVGLYPALGLHPLFLSRHRATALDALAVAVARERPVAIGEIGLDFFDPAVDRQGQQRLFEGQLAIASESGLPVVLHVRRAHDQVLATLRRFRPVGGVAHAFNGSLQQAEQYLALGFRLGFGGMVTYERSRHLRALVAALPLEALVLETDAPDMSPAAHHGERNSPEYLPEVAEVVAQLRDEPLDRVTAQTTANACALFAIADE